MNPRCFYRFVTLLLSVFFSLNGTHSFSQNFERYKDQFNECNVIRYYDKEYQIILEKCTPFDSTQTPYYKLGLYIIKINLPLDLFMKNATVIVFEDGTKIKIKDKISLLYKGNDSNQISTVHQISDSELELLCTKQINYFKLNDYAKEYDKWQREDIIKIFQKLKTEL